MQFSLNGLYRYYRWLYKDVFLIVGHFLDMAIFQQAFFVRVYQNCNCLPICNCIGIRFPFCREIFASGSRLIFT